MKQTAGNYPAPLRILEAVRNGIVNGPSEGYKFESQVFCLQIQLCHIFLCFRVWSFFKSWRKWVSCYRLLCFFVFKTMTKMYYPFSVLWWARPNVPVKGTHWAFQWINRVQEEQVRRGKNSKVGPISDSLNALNSSYSKSVWVVFSERWPLLEQALWGPESPTWQ